MKMRAAGFHSRRRFVPVGVAVLIAAGGIGYGVARADIPDSGIINGCYNTRTGILRVIDLSGHQSCNPGETALSWNQVGPQGPAGPQGPTGPAGPPGPALASIDQLNGIACDGVASKPASVHVNYGTGIEAPLTFTCVTHLVANPGTFTFNVTGGTISTSITNVPLPTNGWSLTGQIDLGGSVTIPAASIKLSNVPFNVTADMGGFSNVQVTGSLSFTSTAINGSLDPGTGAASLSGGLYATVAITATADISGLTTQIYSGTCGIGSATSPIPMTLTTAPPGVPYSQSTGAVTLSGPFTAPSLGGCNPAVPSIYGFLLNFFAGNDQITLSGATNPIIKAT
jgi:hypothetical protein